MINANELRIGNYGLSGGQELMITAQGIVYLQNGEMEFNPIPLTKEWLLKFGFDKKFNKGKITVIPNGRLNYENGRTYFNSWTIMEKQPEYVHQLQNLYFALTGEELTVK